MIRLVLFDIDGTLIYHVRHGPKGGYDRWEKALKRVFGRTMVFDRSVDYNGWVDRQIGWDVCRRHGVTRKEFERRFPDIAKALHDIAKEMAEASDEPLYQAIPEAVRLVHALDGTPDVHIGLLTGNVERVGRWKLAHAGVPDVFRFGLFADEADDRISLAGTVFTRANAFFHTELMPDEITVIGDAVWDVRCAKAIRAHAVAVMTGGHTSREVLFAEAPDVICDTLADPSVVEFFHRGMPAFDGKGL